jgi:hypothetical protein
MILKEKMGEYLAGTIASIMRDVKAAQRNVEAMVASGSSSSSSSSSRKGLKSSESAAAAAEGFDVHDGAQVTKKREEKRRQKERERERALDTEP